MSEHTSATAVRRARVAALALALGAFLIACGAPPPPAVQTHRAPAINNLPENTVVDYQLGGGYPPGPGVGGVVRDSTDVPADGLYSICYVNGFQSQPAERSMWLEDHPDLILTDTSGPVIDENWPDELLFDISTAGNRSRLHALLAPSITECSFKGFDAVEIDNLDSWSRSRGMLDENDALAMATLLAGTAHGAGLAVGQKNSPDLGVRGRDRVGFDFAVAEQCHRYDECGAYTSVYGNRVIDIEYADDRAGSISEICADTGIPYSTIVRDLDLTAPGNPNYSFHSCRTPRLPATGAEHPFDFYTST